MDKCTVIGIYPPPYGGATVKCKLFSGLLKDCGEDTTDVDMYRASRSIAQALQVIVDCIKAFRSEAPVVYCLDTKRLKTMILLQSLFAKSFQNTTVLVIGGTFHEKVKQNSLLAKKLRQVKGIWVETEGMKTRLEGMGFSNIEHFPNAKTEKGCCAPRKASPGEPIHLVYFSQISREKGVEDIISLVDLLDKSKDISYTLDFYGHIVSDFKNEFDSFLAKNSHIKYNGIFDSTKNNVYKKLNEHDILLFPTHWSTEGVPGILVEAKMAGLAVIASNRSYNGEIVQVEKQEGFLLQNHYPEEMLEIIRRCNNDRELLAKVKESSYASRKRYALELYKGMLAKL